MPPRSRRADQQVTADGMKITSKPKRLQLRAMKQAMEPAGISRRLRPRRGFGMHYARGEREYDQPLAEARAQPVSRVPAQGAGQPCAAPTAGRQDHLVIVANPGFGAHRG